MWERIELGTTMIKLRNLVKWARIREGCCVVCTIVWNINYLQFYWNNNNIQEIYDWDNQTRKYMIKSSV